MNLVLSPTEFKPLMRLKAIDLRNSSFCMNKNGVWVLKIEGKWFEKMRKMTMHVRFTKHSV